MRRNKTTDEFIIEANKIHLNRYDYSKINYINTTVNVEIICKEHGLFEQIQNIIYTDMDVQMRWKK
jgi:hypothetical protein